MKFAIALVVALVTVAGASLIYFRLTPFALDGVSISGGSNCVPQIGAEPSARSRWNEGTLFLDISESQSCDDTLQTAVVQRLGGTFFVRTTYGSNRDEVSSEACRCNFSLSVPGVPQNDYEVTVYNLP